MHSYCTVEVDALLDSFTEREEAEKRQKKIFSGELFLQKTTFHVCNTLLTLKLRVNSMLIDMANLADNDNEAKLRRGLCVIQDMM